MDDLRDGLCLSTGLFIVTTTKSPSSSSLALPSFMPGCERRLPNWTKDY